jgi:hypothetical protein
MPSPKLSREQSNQVTGWVAAYIAEQRAAFRQMAQPIPAAHRRKIERFFPGDVLSAVCVVRGRASEPAFYSQLRALGIKNAPAFSGMAGVTFQDVVVHAEALSPALLFHELVHAVQYKHLGLRGFAERYVGGFFSGGSYEEIPLEKQAYELEGKFAANPEMQFSVEDDVIRRIRSNQF